MNDISNTEILTLEDLQQRRAEALEELRTQKQVMSDTARNLFAPIAPAADKGTAIMRAFNTGMAVFDGAMLGIKLMRKSRRCKPESSYGVALPVYPGIYAPGGYWYYSRFAAGRGV